ncbi:MAG: hypothetical protein V4505_26710 [Pseudomonadota bacterium]
MTTRNALYLAAHIATVSAAIALVVLGVSSPAFAQQQAAAPAARAAAPAAPLDRATVQAEVLRARAAGTLHEVGESYGYSQTASLQATPVRTRAEMKADMLQARERRENFDLQDPS